MLKYHLDRRVTASDDQDNVSLYKWSLSEVAENGQQIGGDLIPWFDDLKFVAYELSLTDKLEITTERHSPSETTKSTANRNISINGKMRPNGSGAIRDTSYSMLGSERRISQFFLHIEELGEGQTEPNCSVSGGVGCSVEIDFRNEHIEDDISFMFQVSSDQFSQYVDAIRNASLSALFLRVGLVSGFYSNWSPSISTNKIKVLTADDNHKVELPEGWAWSLPRLGNVGRSQISLQLTRALDTSFLDDIGFDTQVNQDSPLVKGPLGAVVEQVDPRVVKHLSSIKLAAWTIAALLLALTLKACT